MRRSLSENQFPTRKIFKFIFMLYSFYVGIWICVSLLCELSVFSVFFMLYYTHLSGLCSKIFIFACREKLAFFWVKLFSFIHISCFQIQNWFPKGSLTKINDCFAKLRVFLEHIALRTDWHETSS